MIALRAHARDYSHVKLASVGVLRCLELGVCGSEDREVPRKSGRDVSHVALGQDCELGQRSERGWLAVLIAQSTARAGAGGRADPPPPSLETKNQLRPLPQMPGIFSFVALKYRNLLPGLTSSAAASLVGHREPSILAVWWLMTSTHNTAIPSSLQSVTAKSGKG